MKELRLSPANAARHPRRHSRDLLIGWIVSWILIEFRAFRLWRSKNWQTICGTVAGTSQLKGFLGGYRAEVVYTYSFGGAHYGGSDRVSFLFKSSAEEYLGRFLRGKELAIRVQPDKPDVSMVAD